MADWGEFEQRIQPVAAGGEEYAELCAAALTTPAGRLLIDFLFRKYVDTNCHESSSESALRAADAKRFLVRELIAQTAKGLAQRTAKAKQSDDQAPANSPRPQRRRQHPAR